ncbi:cytidylyltransferase domain-containing protein [Bacillus halotolerans]|uniref:cytidylyltransferase domain-containing protein n=1 Tax=Bacillus halotolerans TaxID=260554 RepID=UPI002DBD5C0A|nr:spore coat protein [Bacillus halotolerans]MEC1646474.1 spore coat protein [Bacillus halotolerans]
MDDILFIVQARMGSERLPGKVLRPLGSEHLLDILVQRVRQSAFYQKERDNLVIATSDKKADDVLEAHCINNGIRVFRGSEERVLDRFARVIKASKPEVVIRLTGDNPFVDPELLDMMISAHLDQGADYTYILNTPLGICGEAVSAKLLLDISGIKMLEDKYQEHVTLYVRKHPHLYRLQFLEAPEQLCAPQYRLTVDTEEDYQLVSALYQKAGERPDVSAAELISLLNQHPDLAAMNGMTKQKEVE